MLAALGSPASVLRRPIRAIKAAWVAAIRWGLGNGGSSAILSYVRIWPRRDRAPSAVSLSQSRHLVFPGDFFREGAMNQAKVGHRAFLSSSIISRKLVRAAFCGVEFLETRRLLAAHVYVNDNWAIMTDVGPPGMSGGDTVESQGTDSNV